MEELRAWANEWPIKERVVGILVQIFDDGIFWDRKIRMERNLINVIAVSLVAFSSGIPYGIVLGMDFWSAVPPTVGISHHCGK